jgi:hypothetical protein
LIVFIFFCVVQEHAIESFSIFFTKTKLDTKKKQETKKLYF